MDLLRPRRRGRSPLLHRQRPGVRRAGAALTRAGLALTAGWSPTGTTRLAAVIGSPVRHSLSPVIHNAAFRELGLDWTYLAFDVAPGRAAEALAGVRALGIDGLSVTMPHKADVAAAVDELSPAAEALGAVNCVVHRDDRLYGENTDGGGFIDSLGFDPGGHRFAVLGAGGAARAVIRALADAGASDVVVVNRTPDRAARAAALAGPAGRTGSTDAVAGAEVVVNATSVGMAGTPAAGTLPLDVSLLKPSHVVVDLVYEPAVTPLLAAASEVGADVIGGLGMLVHQAARAFQLWTGATAPVDVMTEAVRSRLTR